MLLSQDPLDSWRVLFFSVCLTFSQYSVIINYILARIAQLVEWRTENPYVTGSSPVPSTMGVVSGTQAVVTVIKTDLLYGDEDLGGGIG